MLFILLVLLSATCLNAQTVTFAQFFELNGSNDFIFTNNGTTANFKTIPNGSPISFIYQNVANLPMELRGPQTAHIVVTAATGNQASNTNSGRTVQPFDQAYTIKVLRDAPAAAGSGLGSRTNLLSITITPSNNNYSIISGDTGGNAAGYSATTPNQDVLYTSDFINFVSNQGSERNLSLSFSSVVQSFAMGTGGFLSSFAAAGSGTFASNPGPTYNVPTSASTVISGRVLNLKGRGVANARVNLTDAFGQTTAARTNSFGYYTFSSVPTGQTAIFTVSSKQYSYMPRVLNVSEELNGFDFVPQ